MRQVFVEEDAGGICMKIQCDNVTFLFRHSRTRVHPSGGTRAREIRHFRKMPLLTFCNTLCLHRPCLSRATLVLASANVVAWAHLDTNTIESLRTLHQTVYKTVMFM
jgi:hypothetical protein